MKKKLGIVLVLCFGLLTVGNAQEDAKVAYNKIKAAIEAKNYEEGLATVEKLINDFPVNRSLESFGPDFGTFWYMKGVCELGLGKFNEALESFDTCHDKFPNGIEETDEGGKVADGVNRFVVPALLKAGEAAQKAENWETAIKRYKQYAAERDPAKHKLHEGIHNINLAICYMEDMKVKEGLPYLEKALKNRRAWGTPQTAIMSCFQLLARKCLDVRDEDTLVGFINKHRAALTVQPTEMSTYALLFVKLGGQAIRSNLFRSGESLYSLVPPSKSALQEIDARLTSLGGLKQSFQDGQTLVDPKALKKAEKDIKKLVSSATAPDCYILPARAHIMEKMGNMRAAFQLLRILEDEFPKNEQREVNLYNLVRTSGYLEDIETTEKYGDAFLKAYPDSDFAESVSNLMLAGLYYSGEYEEGLRTANNMIDDFEEGTSQHDTCLFVQGACLHYLGRIGESVEPIEKHIKLYPDREGRFHLDARYIEASNQVRLQFWDKAAILLDKFLGDFPEPGTNRFYTYALLDRANCHYTEGELDEATEILERIEKEFPQSSIIDSAYNLHGTVLEDQGDLALAEDYYKKAHQAAKASNHFDGKAEALYNLVRLLGDEKSESKAEALPYYDEFWADHPGSYYGAQMAVAGMTAMREADRGEEALQRLQEVISRLARVPGSPGLEEAINSYTEAYLESHSPEELREHFYNFPGIEPSDKPANAMLRVAIIGVFQEQEKNLDPAKDDDKIRRIEAMTKALFGDLRSDFELKDLTNLTLFSVGDYLREKSKSPGEAIAYYEEILNRDDPAYRFEALFGIADILGNSGQKADTDKAIASLERVIKDSGDSKMERRAFFRIMQIRHSREEWDDVIEMATLYFKEKRKGFDAEVSLMLSQAYDGSGQRDEAISMYSRTWLQHKGFFKVSLPSIRRMMELLWERDGPAKEGQEVADRQLAYNSGWTFIDMSRRIYEGPKITREEKKAWEAVQALVLDYEARPEIKSMKEQLEEKK